MTAIRYSNAISMIFTFNSLSEICIRLTKFHDPSYLTKEVITQKPIFEQKVVWQLYVIVMRFQ